MQICQLHAERVGSGFGSEPYRHESGKVNIKKKHPKVKLKNVPSFTYVNLVRVGDPEKKH